MTRQKLKKKENKFCIDVLYLDNKYAASSESARCTLSVNNEMWNATVRLFYAQIGSFEELLNLFTYHMVGNSMVFNSKTLVLNVISALGVA